MDWFKKISFDKIVTEVQQSDTREIPTPSYDCPFDTDDSLAAKVPFKGWDVINLWDAWLTFGTNNEVGRGTSKNKFNGRIDVIQNSYNRRDPKRDINDIDENEIRPYIKARPTKKLKDKILSVWKVPEVDMMGNVLDTKSAIDQWSWAIAHQYHRLLQAKSQDRYVVPWCMDKDSFAHLIDYIELCLRGLDLHGIKHKEVGNEIRKLPEDVREAGQMGKWDELRGQLVPDIYTAVTGEFPTTTSDKTRRT